MTKFNTHQLRFLGQMVIYHGTRDRFMCSSPSSSPHSEVKFLVHMLGAHHWMAEQFHADGLCMRGHMWGGVLEQISKIHLFSLSLKSLDLLANWYQCRITSTWMPNPMRGHSSHVPKWMVNVWEAISGW